VIAIKKIPHKVKVVHKISNSIIIVKLGTERNSTLEGWLPPKPGIGGRRGGKILIDKTKILHPVSPLCKHSRNPPLKRGM
jgi:hypothetical protein